MLGTFSQLNMLQVTKVPLRWMIKMQLLIFVDPLSQRTLVSVRKRNERDVVIEEGGSNQQTTSVVKQTGSIQFYFFWKKVTGIVLVSSNVFIIL